jgi:class 3 adenylate cyclase
LKTFGSSIRGDPRQEASTYHVDVERKLATVLFVDLVDSTERLAGRDPEVVRRQVTRFFDEVAHCIVTHGGTVEKFAGDAVMAAFGIPLAHEDDAERAVRAAFATLAKVRELDLQARIGIESGEVVSDDQRESTFATGEPVNLAARLQQAAQPGEILVGAGTARLVQERIELESLAPVELRGFDAPVLVYRVRSARLLLRWWGETPSSSCWRTPSSAPSATSVHRS